MNLPRARAVKQCDAASARTQCEMHGQTVATDQTTMVSDVSKMLKQGLPAWQNINYQPPRFEFLFERIVMGPIFHRPNRSGFRGDGHVAGKIRPCRSGQ